MSVKSKLWDLSQASFFQDSVKKKEVYLSQIVKFSCLHDNKLFLSVLGISNTVLKFPEVTDPYESKIVEVRDSLIPGAGQGLFAKQSVEKGCVVAYFAGVVVDGQQCNNSEYSISWTGGLGLDIPEDLRQTYCSTLGHKACHSFSPNCQYTWAVHPRFGRIRAVVALKNLDRGDEILTDYKYNYNKAPQWYREDLTNYLVNNFNMGVPEISEYINKLENSRNHADRIELRT